MSQPKRKLVLQLGLLALFVFLVYRIWQAFDLNQRYHRYSQALVSLQAQPLKAEPQAHLPYRYPPLKDLVLDQSASTWSLKDTYTLRSCGLDGLVFSNNSTQSKIQAGWHKLRYQLNLINGLHRCLDNEQLKPAFAMKITQLLDHKRGQLPIYWNNFLASEPALINQWQVSGMRYSRERNYREFPVEHIKVMIKLGDQLSSTPHALPIIFSHETIIAALEVYEQESYLYPLSADLTLALNWLPTLNRQLSSILECAPAQQNIVENIMLKFFIQGIQVELARLDTQLNKIRQPLEKLYYGSTSQMQVTELFQKQAQLHQHLVAHVKQWQRLRKLCANAL